MVDDCFGDKVSVITRVDDDTFTVPGGSDEVAVGGQVADGQGLNI